MKKLLLIAAIALCGLTASAQNWAAGLRVGSALEAVGQCSLSSANYVEGRFGMYYANSGGTVMANFTALYNWHLRSWGDWYFDAGLGLTAGGREHYAYVGLALMARGGYHLTGNIDLALDWTPCFGPQIAYGHGHSDSSFYKYGLPNLGLSMIYKF